VSTSPPLPQAPPGLDRTRKLIRWHRRVLTFCLIVFAFELGVFLVVFPWVSNWDISWVPIHSPRFSNLWMSPYFRGALSGLGFLDLWVALAELSRQLKSIFGKT
jgi:hypothetical protein